MVLTILPSDLMSSFQSVPYNNLLNAVIKVLGEDEKMVKSINIKQYRKLKNLNFDMSPHLNAISGTNGTCKTSLLHMISNSFKAVPKTADWITSTDCIQVINSVNDVVNPKVESLTRGDKKYNDPAHGVSGVLFSVDYFNHSPLDFRRHNSPENTRYAIKPMYQRGAGDKLPSCPVLYLGLSRLVPYGEFKRDDSVRKVKKTLPDEYQSELERLYKDFTHYEISEVSVQQMGDVKVRAEFDSTAEGVDSNTISAGEDNLYIILLSLISLKYYFNCIESKNECESILLVDELDATLHPAFQIKLLDLLRNYSKEYKIQVFFTTHSMTTLENLLKEKDKVFYLLDNVTSVTLMEEPDIYKIQMHLNSLTKKEIYYDKVIPVFSEDDEARFFINLLFDYYEEKRPEFVRVRRLFHFVDINLGADNLVNIFKDLKLLRSTMKAICILDGDHQSDLNSNIVALPGKNKVKSNERFSPEQLLFDYANILYEEDDEFWVNDAVINMGYGKRVYIERIHDKLAEFKKQKEEAAAAKEQEEAAAKEQENAAAKEQEKVAVKKQKNKEVTNKKPREFNKELFKNNIDFFYLLFKRWLNDDRTNEMKDKFFQDLKVLFRKNAQYNGINPNEWMDN